MTEQRSPGEPTVQSKETRHAALKALLKTWRESNRDPLIFAQMLTQEAAQ